MTTIQLTDAQGLALGDLLALAVGAVYNDSYTDVAKDKYLESPLRVRNALFAQLDQLLDIPGAGRKGAR